MKNSKRLIFKDFTPPHFKWCFRWILVLQTNIIFCLAALAQGSGSVSGENCGIKITLTSSVDITDGKACIPQCLREAHEGYQSELGSPITCENTVTFTAEIENTGFPGDFTTVGYYWQVNGSTSGTGFGGIEMVGTPTTPTLISGKLYTTVTVKSKASNWDWTPGSVSFRFEAPPVPIFCPGDTNPVSTCPGCTGFTPAILVFKQGTLPPVPELGRVIIGEKCVKVGQIYQYSVIARFTKDQDTRDNHVWNVTPMNVNLGSLPFGMSWLQGFKVEDFAPGHNMVLIRVEPDFEGGILQVVAGTGNNCNTEVYELPVSLIPPDFRIKATNLNGDPISGTSICLPMNDLEHTFSLELESLENYPLGHPLAGQKIPLTNLNLQWSHSPSDAFLKIDNGSNKLVATYKSKFPDGCPRGSTGTIEAICQTNCPAPNTPHSASFAIKRSFTDHEITTDPAQSPICVDDLGQRQDFYIQNVSCNTVINWIPPPTGWYVHNPMADEPTNGSVWSGHAASPPTINGQSQIVQATDGCGNTRSSQPLVVSWNNLEIDLELIPPGDGKSRCPEIKAHIINLPEGCCSDNFEFVWTHKNGNSAFCNGLNPSGCGQNYISVWEPGLISLIVKSCKTAPCACFRSERYTLKIPNNAQTNEWFLVCDKDSNCPEAERNCEPYDPEPDPSPERPAMNQNLIFPKRATGVQIIPNPARNQLTIQLLERMEDGSYMMMDALGKTVAEGKWKGKFVQIKTDALPRGTYSIKINSGKKVIHQSVVLE